MPEIDPLLDARIADEHGALEFAPVPEHRTARARHERVSGREDRVHVE